MKIREITTKEYVLTQEEADNLVYSIKTGEMTTFSDEFMEQVEEQEDQEEIEEIQETTEEENQEDN